MVNLAKDYITHDIISLKLVKQFEPQISIVFGKKWEQLRDVMMKEPKVMPSPGVIGKEKKGRDAIHRD
jgi:hypothetical protein